MFYKSKYRSEGWFIRVATIILLIGSLNPVIAETTGDPPAASGWLPFSPAPEGQWGGAVITEYDQRTIGSDELAVRRILMRLGWSPTGYTALWIEGGVASLYMESSGAKVQGDFGTALGAGISLCWSEARILDLSPFAAGRGTMYISRLGSQRIFGNGLSRSTRSRYEWWETYGVAGLVGDIGGSRLFFGPCCRSLYQQEDRHTRTSNNISWYKEKHTYQSAIQPGFSLGLHLPLKLHFNTYLSGEIYEAGFKVTFSAGQWGLL
jgi:hypothetical protein